jgi:hypothetical protein
MGSKCRFAGFTTPSNGPAKWNTKISHVLVNIDQRTVFKGMKITRSGPGAGNCRAVFAIMKRALTPQAAKSE